MRRRHLLIVEEDPAAAKALRRRLAELGYETASLAPDVSASRAEAPVFIARSDIPRETGRTDGTPAALPIVAPGLTDRELCAVVELALTRHEAERVTRELEAFFTVAVDLFCFLDFTGYFKRLNPAWEDALGFTRKELMSRPFIEFVHPDDRDRTLAQNAAVRAGGRAMGFENRYLRKDGSHRWLRWNAMPFTAERVVYSVARDITREKQAETDRERLVRELEASLAEVRSLQAILPICSYCRKVRDDRHYWHTVEDYISRHTESRFSHGICPACLARFHPEFINP